MPKAFYLRRCKQVCIYIQPETDKWVREYCKSERLTRSEFLGEFIDKYIMRLEEPFTCEEDLCSKK